MKKNEQEKKQSSSHSTVDNDCFRSACAIPAKGYLGGRTNSCLFSQVSESHFGFLAKKTYDAVVVGSGSTGGWACKTLTEAGMSVLLLEIGEHPDDIPLGHGPERVVLPRKKYFATEEEFPYATDSSPSFRWHRVLKYGGRSIYWNRISLRLSNFEMKAATLDGYGLDWPVDENELAPFYSEAEKFFWRARRARWNTSVTRWRFFTSPTFSPCRRNIS